jgi:signal transduction histidine kinase
MNVEPSAMERIASVAWIAELYRLSTIAASSNDTQDALQLMLTHIVEGFGAVSGSLSLVPESESAVLELVAGIDLPAHLIGRRVAFGEGILGKVAAAGKSLLLQGETGKTPGMERSKARGSSMCWPLVVKDRVVGALAVNRAVEQPAYTKEDLERGQIMANVVALVVDNSAMHRESLRRIEALSRMNAELSAAHQQIKEAQSQLLQSEKMASIGQLAAGVAHEINNPVGYVYSNVGSLERYVQDLLRVVDAYGAALPAPGAELKHVLEQADLPFLREDVVTLLGESREGLDRVRSIVQNLKDFSRVDAGDEWLIADLTDGLRSTLNIVRNELKYRAEVTCDFKPLPPIECLPSQLNQVFMNLLVNAGQALKDKGTIRISTGCSNHGEAARAEVWVEVTDNGCGIPPEIQSRIFEPFFTTKPVGKGTGLGLSLSYSIVQKHHGRIEVRSAVGAGTTFRVVLPLKRMKNE